MEVYRVVYYTIAGTRVKDFTGPDAEIKAQEFYDRHVKKHPEYQDSGWSRTEIVVHSK